MLPLWIVLALLPVFGGAERFNCRTRILGAYYADFKSGCKAFHVCVRVAGGGIRDFRFFCPPGTLFHQEAQTCTDWGDDDPLACPADLYDGQFDLYKIGSGYDTKKLSSQGTRDEDTEFGLQRAETGDRRSQNNNNANIANNGPASDLRAAHSSDFFSGQRDRGRDDPAPAPRPSSQSPQRQSFRRATSPRTTALTTQYTTTVPPQPSNPPSYESSKRKIIRKRPISISNQGSSSFAQNTPQQSFPPKQNNPPQFSQQQPQQAFPPKQNNPPQAFQQSIPPKQNNPPQTLQQQPHQSFPPKQNNPPQFSQQQSQQPFPPKQNNPPQSFPQQSYQQQQQNFNRGPPQNRQTTTLAPPTDIPPQYRDEYVEVPRVAPKQSKANRYFPTNPTAAPFPQSSPTLNTKKDGLVELYNYDSQSTPGLNVQKESRPFKVRNSFSVQDEQPREDFVRLNVNSNSARFTSTTEDYSTATSRGFATSTPAYKNFNSVSYEPEKNNFASFSGNKQKYFNNPTTTPSTTTYTTQSYFNTNAYNTNIALNTIQPANYGNSEEDDGQYRPPQGEDDGQYRPELYERERELLSGAHSLNIAASGNRLPEDQKPYGKSQGQQKPKPAQTSAPRPFRPAPTASVASTTTYAPEPSYSTTYRAPTVNTQRTFDYFQTYTTTSRPTDLAAVEINFGPVNNPPARPTTSAPQTPEPRLQTRAPVPTSRAPVPSSTRGPPPPTVAPPQSQPTKRPHSANPSNKQEDSNYDYAYYDSDTGFSEYDHIEEFGRTKTKA